MRLIDADALEDVLVNHGFCFCNESDYSDGVAAGFLLAINDVIEAPTIEAEPIVRCKDCKHFDGSYPMCCRFEEEFKPDDYCSFGEKIDEDAD